jgi:pyruvate dehydrogenase E2 component (dihydrolipoamide acetyltransferase)
VSFQVLMPRVSDSMEEAVISRWLRADGDSVGVGEPLVEVETDKTTVEVAAETAGVLRILAGDGAAVAPGSVIADILAPGEEQAVRPATARLRATPIARRLAREHALDLASLAPGSGPLGRIHRIDVERELRERQPGVDVVAPTRAQAAAASRTAASKREIPHYYVTVEVDATRVLRRRDELAAAGERVTLTDLVAFATARTLVEHPALNSSWSDRGIVRHAQVNLGLAVSLENGDLIVPVLAGAEALSLGEVATAIRDLAERTRAGHLAAAETAGGTFTITNLGMYGVGHFHAIINPPESGILAIGAVSPTPAVVEGRLVEIPRFSLSLSADHRVYAGVAAARFLGDLRNRLEA